MFKINGSMATLLAVIVISGSSCKKDVDVNVMSTGNFSDTTAPLKESAEFPIGVAISYTPMLTDTRYSSIVKRDFDAVTFDYHMKHGAIVQNNGTMNFTNTDALVAASSGLQIFGHTLGWHQNQNASYLKTYAGIVVAAAAESLVNGGFETGDASSFSNWATYNALNGATVSVGAGSNEVRTGTRSMKVVNPVANPGNQWRVQVASDLFNTTPGKDYSVTYYVKAAAAGGSIRLSTQTSGGGSAQYQGDQTIGTAFSVVSWSFTANSPQTRILFDMGQAANTYYIDDASVKEVIPAPSGTQIAAKLDTALKTFIDAMVGRYKDKVHAWDVINEILADNGTIRTNANTTAAADVLVWSNYLGKDFALKAFQYAAAADPSALLFINDYGLEGNAVKLDSMIKLVNDLKTAGAKIDGIGTQMHISWNTPYVGIDDMFKKLAATGLKIRISELDVKTVLNSAAKKLTPQNMAYQANMYQYVVNSYMKFIPAAQRAGITVWGLTDNTSWLYNNGAEFPLLYDVNYNKKPAYSGFLQALRTQ